jgi:hypothetical protein
MERCMSETEHVVKWLIKCLKTADLQIHYAVLLRKSAGREVWDCLTQSRGIETAVTLTIFHAGDLAKQNTNLEPVLCAKKCAWAMQQLRDLNIATPRCSDPIIDGEEAAIAVQKITSEKFSQRSRIIAAQNLARLHSLSVEKLSPELRELVDRSDPKASRTYAGLKSYTEKLDKRSPQWRDINPLLAEAAENFALGTPPDSGRRTLVHGDYFSSNIIATVDGIRIIDWETFAIGDPMWDLAFLVGADEIGPAETEGTIQAYAALAPMRRGVLDWHMESWRTGWGLRDLMKRQK